MRLSAFGEYDLTLTSSLYLDSIPHWRSPDYGAATIGRLIRGGNYKKDMVTVTFR